MRLGPNAQHHSRTPRPALHRRGAMWQAISPGAWIILVLAIISGILIAIRPARNPDHELEFWAFADTHVAMYKDMLYDPKDGWNATHQPIPGVPGSGLRVKLLQLSITAEQQRLMSGFYADTPIADLMEIERTKVGGMFAMPLSKIGLYDLTDRIKKEGILDQINAPSFSPWTSRGHIFGLPHDVHPVMLCYRSDIVEAAGIDVSQIETWDDYVRLMSPLMQEKDKDGNPKHYLLNLWPTAGDQIEILLLQNDGRYFDADGVPVINSPQNVETLCQITLWCTGPTRIAADTPEFDAGANKLRVDGYVIGSLMPDWLSGTWQTDMPQLKGKVKLMPLPAWHRANQQGLSVRHTGIWGGTMLAISRNTPNFEKAWEFAKTVYTSKKNAEILYRKAGIVSPVKAFWHEPFYSEPSPYFSGQPAGELYLKPCAEVPLRTTSPFQTDARSMLGNAALELQKYAADNHITTIDGLRSRAQALLDDANAKLQWKVANDLYIDPRLESSPSPFETGNAPETQSGRGPLPERGKP